MKKIKHIILTFLIFFLMLVFLTYAQDEKKTEPETPVDDIEKVETQSEIQQKLASITQITGGTYSYNPVGKPDPFRPFVEIDTPSKKKESNESETKDLSSIFPLQRLATENFRVVGIVGDKIRRIAIVEDATKKFYPIFEGTHIGKKNGKVAEIMADRVIVNERDGSKTKRVILKLHKD